MEYLATRVAEDRVWYLCIEMVQYHTNQTSFCTGTPNRRPPPRRIRGGGRRFFLAKTFALARLKSRLYLFGRSRFKMVTALLALLNSPVVAP